MTGQQKQEREIERDFLPRRKVLNKLTLLKKLCNFQTLLGTFISQHKQGSDEDTLMIHRKKEPILVYLLSDAT